MNIRIAHPWIAFLVITVLSAIMANYGVVDGSLMLFDLFAGIAIYKWLTTSF